MPGCGLLVEPTTRRLAQLFVLTLQERKVGVLGTKRRGWWWLGFSCKVKTESTWGGPWKEMRKDLRIWNKLYIKWDSSQQQWLSNGNGGCFWWFLISWTGFSSLTSGILILGGIPNSGIECMDVSDKIHVGKFSRKIWGAQLAVLFWRVIADCHSNMNNNY